MSRFSEKCKELMLENGTNVYRLSNSSSLERTTLQRMVTGKRLPSIDFVKQFCREIRIPSSEEKNLMELYKMEILGDDVYQNRQCIGNLLVHLANLEKIQKTDIPFYHSAVSSSPVSFNSFTGYVCETEINIRTILEKEFASRDASSHIYTNFPADNDWFFHLLQLLHTRYPDTAVSVHHLIHFQMNATLTTYNLRALSSLLPLALSDKLDYTPWYYYSKMQEHDFAQLMFPYFIITADQVLEISGDFQHSLLHTDSTKLNIYTREFEKIRKNANPLFMRYNTPESALTEYMQGLPPISEAPYSLEYQPCFSDMVNEELLEKFLERKPEYIPVCSNLSHLLNHFHDDQVWGAFSQTGVETFCNTQMLTDGIGAFLSPLTKEECILALSNYLNRNKAHHFYMFSDEIQLPSNIIFEISGNKSFRLIKIDDDLQVTLFVITESSICEAFFDFVTSLQDSEYLLSEEESDAFIERKLEELKNSTPH